MLQDANQAVRIDCVWSAHPPVAIVIGFNCQRHFSALEVMHDSFKFLGSCLHLGACPVHSNATAVWMSCLVFLHKYSNLPTLWWNIWVLLDSSMNFSWSFCYTPHVQRQLIQNFTLIIDWQTYLSFFVYSLVIPRYSSLFLLLWQASYPVLISDLLLDKPSMLALSTWDIFNLSTCHMIVNYFWLILCLQQIGYRLQNSNSACRVSFRAILIEHIVWESGFRLAIMYFLYNLGSILRIGSAIVPSNNICTSLCMLAFVNTPGMYVLAMYHPSFALLAQDNIIASSDMLGDLISVLVV